MYQLWARRRPIEGKGFPFEYITSFSNIDQRFYITDQLNREIYQECLVVTKDSCVFYREFDKPMVLKKVKK
jgi:hypothetical protein